MVFEVTLALYVHKASNTYSPLRLPYENHINLKAIIPEAWGFFSKNPREPKYYLYKKISGDWERISLGPNSNPKNYFGLNRQARAQGVEYGLLLVQLRSEKWDSSTTNSLEASLKKAEVKMELKNISPNPTLCDSIAIVSKEIVPWSWAKENAKSDMPLRYIKLVAKCS